jgi:hypothetical protein
MQLHKLLVICSCCILRHTKVPQEYLLVLVAQLAPPAARLLVPEHTPDDTTTAAVAVAAAAVAMAGRHDSRKVELVSVLKMGQSPTQGEPPYAMTGHLAVGT